MELPADVLARDHASLPIERVIDAFSSDEQTGLSQAQVSDRISQFGPNIVSEDSEFSLLKTFLGQFKSPLILLLLAASAVTIAIGDYKDAGFIFAAVLVNAVLGFYQEFKAEKALAELKTYLRERARVIREGNEREVDASELVPGDLIRVGQGDRIPADARLLFTNDLQIDEAVLTGEALPVVKDIAPVKTGLSLGDQTSMVFAGTLVSQGVGTALVCRTGNWSELGRIAQLVSAAENEETPLQEAIRRFSIKASWFLGALTLLIFIIGLISGVPLVDMFLTGVAIAVSAVPEGLPIAMTVILAIGVERMAKRKGVVRRLSAAEALGSADVILTDKTGTLTTGQMEIGRLIPRQGSEQALLSHALANVNVLIENPDAPASQWRIDGKLIEVALARSAHRHGVDMLALRDSRIMLDSLPFNAVNKYSLSLIEEAGKKQVVMLGAPDMLLPFTTLNKKERQDLEERIEKEASAGALVLGVAVKDAHAHHKPLKDMPPEGYRFEGLITLRDPIREQVKEAIRKVEEFGTRIVLLTGDHLGTAVWVAQAAGLSVPAGSVIDAAQLRELSDKELQARLGSLSVIARVSPLDKMRIAQAFQRDGKVVAMTGDGVNDAPSIKQADVGIAMGSGTAVARNVADLVLLDDNFETIAAAIEEGRQIRGNLRKVLVYLLSDTTDELFLIGGALLVGLPQPLTALQILWVNFFSDSFPALAFAFEKERDAVGKVRRGRTELFDPLMSFLILFVGVGTSALLFVLYGMLLAYGHPPDVVRTFIYASFASYTLFCALSFRSLTRSIFSYSPFGNPMLLLGIGIGLSLIIGSLYIPVLQDLLGTVALPLPWLVAVLAVAVANIAVIEFAKYVFPRLKRS